MRPPVLRSEPLTPWNGAPDGDAAAVARGARWMLWALALLFASLVGALIWHDGWWDVMRYPGAALDALWTCMATWGLWTAGRPGAGRLERFGHRRQLRLLAVLPILATAACWAFTPQDELHPLLDAWEALRPLAWFPPLVAMGRHARALARPGTHAARASRNLGPIAAVALAVALLWVRDYDLILLLVPVLYKWHAIFAGGLALIGFGLLDTRLAFDAHFTILKTEAPTWGPAQLPDRAAWLKGREMRVREMTELAPPGLERVTEIRGLAERAPGLRIVVRAEDASAADRDTHPTLDAHSAISDVLRSGDPILDRLLQIQGPPESLALIDGLHAELLAALHQHPASSVEDGRLYMRFPDGAIPEGATEAALALIDALERRLAGRR